MLLLLGTVVAFAAPLKVTLKAEDGQRIYAQAEKVKGSTKGIVLLHGETRSSADWSYMADKFVHKDFQVISPDLRGHGTSTMTHELTNDDYIAMVGDVKASFDWLRKQGVQQISCIGSKVGANLCLRAAAESPDVVNVVMLSPGLNYKGVTTGDALATYGDRPVLFVASDDDSYATKSAGVLVERATGQKHYELLSKAGSGTKMLNRDPGLEGTLMAWVLGTYTLASGDVVLPKPGVETDIGTVETEGTKLEAHQ